MKIGESQKDIAPPLITALTLRLKRVSKCWQLSLYNEWDVLPLESLCNSKIYLLRVKLNRGDCMSREEKNWLCEAVNSNTYFRTAVPLQGYRFDFFDVLKKYLVNQYGQWTEYYAPDRTSLRAYLYGRINQIVEIPKY